MRCYLTLLLIVAAPPCLSGEQQGRKAEVNICQIDGPIDHNHCTTRQFQHMSFCHEEAWFVFYSDGRDFRYQTSVDDGRTWERASEPVATAPNGSSSHDVLQVGNTVYLAHAFYPLGRYDVNAPYARDPARRGEYKHEGRIKKGRIEGRRIRWLQDVDPGFTPDYCNLVQDSNGYFWVFTREDQQGTAHRSSKPNAIDTWEPESICLPVKGRHALDTAALENGMLYVVSLLTTEGTLYGNLYEGTDWGATPVLIADNLTTVAGDDRRLAVEFDPTQNRLHLTYVDRENKLRYRHLDSPYSPSDWTPALAEPGLELESGVFTCALSVDSSKAPHELAITYGQEKHVGKDKRQRTGDLYSRCFDGKSWLGEPLRISQTDTIFNWYPNVNRDAEDGLCVLYSRSMNERNLGIPLAVMVSVCPSIR